MRQRHKKLFLYLEKNGDFELVKTVAGGDCRQPPASGERRQVVLRRDDLDRRPEERGHRLQHGHSGSGWNCLRPEEEVRRQEGEGKNYSFYAHSYNYVNTMLDGSTNPRLSRFV